MVSNTSFESLIEGEDREITVLANAASYINMVTEDVSWVGFYLKGEDESLYLGPFQGKPACTYIKFGKGVCGTAASGKKTQVVPDVFEFPGYIACDAAARSEIVVPMLKNDGSVYGVLDIDSDSKDRFLPGCEGEFEEYVRILMKRLDKWFT